MKKLFYGDNLDILRDYIADNSIDLVYLDPPFNSKKAYSQIFPDKNGKYPPSQIKAFDDTWHWCDESEKIMNELSGTNYPPELFRSLKAFREILGTSDMMAYLVMMSVRLQELKRVMKDTASIYLHCDPTASHYLKIVMDQIFGVTNYISEITWLSSTDTGSSKARAKTFPRMVDIILFYSKTKKYFFNPLFEPYEEEYIESKFKYEDENGKYRWQVLKTFSQKTFDKLQKEKKLKKTAKSKYYYYKQYLSTSKGVIKGNLWDDIMPLGPAANEKMGYPTQKPLALLERILNASSKKGNIVLDPFCGCGTTVAAAEKLGRQWIGIDITVRAIAEIEDRMKNHFPGIKYELKGCPKDVESARKMAGTQKGKFEFESWFIRALGGQPFKSSGGADKGIDGFMYFKDLENKLHTVVVSVKGGGYNRENIAALTHVVERENASMGLLLALNEPTGASKSEAASAGRFQLPGLGRTYPKVQIFTVEDYFAGKRPDLPDVSDTLKKAKRIEKSSEGQTKLEL